MTEVVTFDKNDTIRTDMRGENAKMAVQLELVQLSFREGIFSSTFKVEDNQFKLIRLYRSTFGSDVPLTLEDIAQLSMYGITVENPVLEIVKLNKNIVILKGDNKELHFRRY